MNDSKDEMDDEEITLEDRFDELDRDVWCVVEQIEAAQRALEAGDTAEAKRQLGYVHDNTLGLCSLSEELRAACLSDLED